MAVLQTRRVTLRDFHDFFREEGLGKDLPCPMCKTEAQFGWSDKPAPQTEVEFLIPMVGASADPGKDNFFQTCDNCGFVEVFFLAPFCDWIERR